MKQEEAKLIGLEMLDIILIIDQATQLGCILIEAW